MQSRGALNMMANANVTMSFNTERDTRGVKPGTHLDEKEKQEVRRSSYTEDQTSFKKKLENGGLIKKGEGETGDSSPSPALEEPMAPGGPKRVVSSKNQFSGMLAPQKKTPVILNSKPVFSNLHKKRDERKDEVASLSTSSTPVPGASEGGGKREGSSATTG